MDYDRERYRLRQVRARGGGGTRSVILPKECSMSEVLDKGKNLFFPNERNKRGHVTDFEFSIMDFSECLILDMSQTVSALYESSKVSMLRLYICTKRVNQKKKPFLGDDPLAELSDDDLHTLPCTSMFYISHTPHAAGSEAENLQC